MNKLIIFSLFMISVLFQSCSIGKDQKKFECTKWTVENKNSSVADRIASIQNQALGAEAIFEFYDNQIRMEFQGDQIIFTKDKNGSYMHERPYYLNGKSGKIRYHLCPREIYGGFISSIDLYFWVDHDQCGEASFSRSW